MNCRRSIGTSHVSPLTSEPQPTLELLPTPEFQQNLKISFLLPSIQGSQHLSPRQQLTFSKNMTSQATQTDPIDLCDSANVIEKLNEEYAQLQKKFDQLIIEIIEYEKIQKENEALRKKAAWFDDDKEYIQELEEVIRTEAPGTRIRGVVFE